MNIIELDDILNATVWCTLAPLSIHGVGVFAIRDIPKGQKMGCQEMTRPQILRILPEELNRLRPEIKKLIIQRWPIVTTKGYFQSPNHDAYLLSFMNHSDTPNYNKVQDTALRDIKNGEEVLEDYGEFTSILKL